MCLWTPLETQRRQRAALVQEDKSLRDGSQSQRLGCWTAGQLRTTLSLQQTMRAAPSHPSAFFFLPVLLVLAAALAGGRQLTPQAAELLQSSDGEKQKEKEGLKQSELTARVGEGGGVGGGAGISTSCLTADTASSSERKQLFMRSIKPNKTLTVRLKSRLFQRSF